MTDENSAGELQHGYIRTALDARQQARTLLSTISAMGVEASGGLSVSQEHTAAHTMTIQYVSHLAPKSEEISDLWEQEVGKVNIVHPPNQTIDAGRSNRWGELDISESAVIAKADQQSFGVSLKTANETWSMPGRAVIVGETQDRRGEDKQIERQYALPPNMLESLFQQADTAMGRLGWLPEATGEPATGPYE